MENDRGLRQPCVLGSGTMGAVLVLLAGCASPPPAQPPSATPEPAAAPAPPGPVVPAPSPTTEPAPPESAPAQPPATSCPLTLRVTATVSGKVLKVSATVRNSSSQDARLSLPSRCPGGPLAYTGLTPGYDFYGTCNMGACAGTEPPTVVPVPAGATVAIGRPLTLPTAGGGCRPPLPPGRHEVTVRPPPGVAADCVHGATVVVPARGAGPSTSPAQGSTTSDARACTRPSDCVLHCPRAPGCCSSAPCGCRQAVHRDKVAQADAEYGKSCQRPPRCLAVGCRRDDAMGATCRRGRCVAIDF